MHRQCADELLTTTRAVRRRLHLDREVPTPLLLECVDVALQAPSSQNRQSWAFVIVTDADKRAALAELYRRAMDVQMAKAAAAPRPALTPAQVRNVESSAWLTEHLADVPVHVVACAKGPLPGLPAGLASATLYGSVLPAAWSFMLAARARGLGTSFTTLHLFFEEEADRIINLPPGWRQVVLIPTAFYRGDGFRRADRRRAIDVVFANEWSGRLDISTIAPEPTRV
jgi:nitroreductase